MKTIKLLKPIKTSTDNYTNISLTTYQDNGHLAIIANNDKNKGKFTSETVILTINIENVYSDEIAIDDNNLDFDFTSEMTEQLVDLGIIKTEGGRLEPSGFATYPVYTLADNIVKENVNV